MNVDGIEVPSFSFGLLPFVFIIQLLYYTMQIRIRNVFIRSLKKYIQSNNETILDQGTPIKTSLVANIRPAYYIINNFFFISQAKNT